MESSMEENLPAYGGLPFGVVAPANTLAAR